MRKWIGNARRQSMRSPVRCHASCEVPVKTLPLRFLWSTRKLEHFVQRVFLCSENIGFLMYITCFLLMLQYLCKLSAELWIVLGTLYMCLYVIVYLFIYISIKHKLLLSQNFIFQNVQPRSAFLLLQTFDSWHNVQSPLSAQTIGRRTGNTAAILYTVNWRCQMLCHKSNDGKTQTLFFFLFIYFNAAMKYF